MMRHSWVAWKEDAVSCVWHSKRYGDSDLLIRPQSSIPYAIHVLRGSYDLSAALWLQQALLQTLRSR
jgi:hypothetical protein